MDAEESSSSNRMFMAQGVSQDFQSRAAAVFGILPTAKLPSEIPDDLAAASSSADGDMTGSDTGNSMLRAGGRNSYVAPARKRDSGGHGRDDRMERNGGRDDSGFEKPPSGLSLSPPRKRRGRTQRTPDYVINPNKYTKYSLEDSPDGPYAGMSDEQKNKAGAAQLFAEIRRRREQEAATEDEDIDKSRVVFRRAADRKTKTSSPDDASQDQSSAGVSRPEQGEHTSHSEQQQSLSFDTSDGDAPAIDAGHTASSMEASDSPVDSGDVAAAAPAPVTFSARKKFRGRRRVVEADDDENDAGGDGGDGND